LSGFLTGQGAGGGAFTVADPVDNTPRPFADLERRRLHLELVVNENCLFQLGLIRPRPDAFPHPRDASSFRTRMVH
jgi:hypothetical protein